MKKKILIALVMFLTLTTPVLASDTVSPGGSGSGSAGHSSAFETCKNGAGDWRRIGVRISAVDETGRRLPGTSSIDILQNASATGAFAGISGGNMQYVSFRVSANPNTEYYMNSNRGQMRNEALTSLNYVNTTSLLGGTVWTGLNGVNLSGSSLKRHFINSFFNNNKTDLISMFYSMGYTEFDDPIAVENHYLVIEPLFQFYWDSPGNNCVYQRRYYYGTGTEVLMMLNMVPGEKVFQVMTSNGSVWNSAVYQNIALGAYIDNDITKNKNFNGASLAGLMSATSYTKAPASVHNHLKDISGNSSIGFASVLIWMGDMINPNQIVQDFLCPVVIGNSQDCTDATSGYIEDLDTDEAWKCVFGTKDAKAGTYESEYYRPNNDTTFSSENPYCTVACIESVDYNFPSIFNVYAGGRFYIATSNNFNPDMTSVGPVNMRGKVTCKTGTNDNNEEKINITKFRTDYTNADAAVLNAYNALQKAKANLAAFENNLGMSSSRDVYHGCNDRETDYGNCLDSEYYVTENGNSFSTGSSDYCYGKTGCTVTGGGCTSYGEKEVSQNRCQNFRHGQEYYYEANWSTGRRTYGGYTSDNITCMSTSHNSNVGYSDDSDGNTCNSTYSSLRNAVNGAQTNYNIALSRRELIIKNLKNCNNFQRTYNEFNPSVSFVYSDPFYRQAYQLASTSQSSSKTTYYANGNVTAIHDWSTTGYGTEIGSYKLGDFEVFGTSSSIASWSCPGNFAGCYRTSITYPTNTNVVQETTKTYDYELPENVYRFVAKNGVSYNTAAEAYNSGYAYKELNQSNLPIKYNTKSGTYDYYLDYYYSNSGENLFGREQKFYKYSVVDPGASTTYNGLTMASNLAYHCTYDVVQRFLEENHNRLDDVNVIYRPISLNDPFPGENGNGRPSGLNWIGTTKVNGEEMSLIDAFITYNRGVEREKVYQLRPMYQFALSSSNVRAIRKYNKEHKNDYNDFTLECTDGYFCKSAFLSEGIENGYFSFTEKNPDGGTCFGASEINWESCRY